MALNLSKFIDFPKGGRIGGAASKIDTSSIISQPIFDPSFLAKPKIKVAPDGKTYIETGKDFEQKIVVTREFCGVTRDGEAIVRGAAQRFTDYQWGIFRTYVGLYPRVDPRTKTVEKEEKPPTPPPGVVAVGAMKRLNAGPVLTCMSYSEGEVIYTESHTSLTKRVDRLVWESLEDYVVTVGGSKKEAPAEVKRLKGGLRLFRVEDPSKQFSTAVAYKDNNQGKVRYMRGDAWATLPDYKTPFETKIDKNVTDSLAQRISEEFTEKIRSRSATYDDIFTSFGFKDLGATKGGVQITRNNAEESFDVDAIKGEIKPIEKTTNTDGIQQVISPEFVFENEEDIWEETGVDAENFSELDEDERRRYEEFAARINQEFFDKDKVIAKAPENGDFKILLSRDGKKSFDSFVKIDAGIVSSLIIWAREGLSREPNVYMEEDIAKLQKIIAEESEKVVTYPAEKVYSEVVSAFKQMGAVDDDEVKPWAELREETRAAWLRAAFNLNIALERQERRIRANAEVPLPPTLPFLKEIEMIEDSGVLTLRFADGQEKRLTYDRALGGGIQFTRKMPEDYEVNFGGSSFAYKQR